MRRRVWFHRSRAIAWFGLTVAALVIPSWQESLAWVIVASGYANVVSDWTASEAADDREIVERLRRIEAHLEG